MSFNLTSTVGFACFKIPMKMPLYLTSTMGFAHFKIPVKMSWYLISTERFACLKMSMKMLLYWLAQQDLPALKFLWKYHYIWQAQQDLPNLKWNEAIWKEVMKYISFCRNCNTGKSVIACHIVLFSDYLKGYFTWLTLLKTKLSFRTELTCMLSDLYNAHSITFTIFLFLAVFRSSMPL